MTYNVFSGTLNPTESVINLLSTYAHTHTHLPEYCTWTTKVVGKHVTAHQSRTSDHVAL